MRDLPRVLATDQKAFKQAVLSAVKRTALWAEKPIKKRVPVAFGEIRDSVQGFTSGTPIITSVDAPHAAAVEIGSMPHRPDFERLLAWVRLRGMQGLTPRGNIKTRFAKILGPTTALQASRVASLFKTFEVRGKRGVGRHSPIDSAEEIAKAISAKIAKHGTRPHFFVRDSLPEIGEYLGAELKKKLDSAFKQAASSSRFNRSSP